jgi:hypothetical protein
MIKLQNIPFAIRITLLLLLALLYNWLDGEPKGWLEELGAFS